jgi:hypothetical protein
MADLQNKQEEFAEGEEIVEVVDLDGELFEKLGELQYEGETYFALIPYEEYDEDSGADDGSGDSEESEDAGYAEFGILRNVEEDGEFFLETLEDDDLEDKLGAMFEKMFAELLEE